MNKIQILENKITLLEEDLECIHMHLDDMKIPRSDDKGEEYSIVGRIDCLVQILKKENSQERKILNLEDFLESNKGNLKLLSNIELTDLHTAVFAYLMDHKSHVQDIRKLSLNISDEFKRRNLLFRPKNYPETLIAFRGIQVKY